MKRLNLTPLALTLLLATVACGKVQEKASEKVAEAAIESAMKQQGAKDAHVDLSTGGVKTTVTDKDGKQQTLELNTAQITEADLGLPFYPGTKPAEGAANRMTNDQGVAMTLNLVTKDALDKVVAFYDPQIKKAAAGKQLVESSGPTEHMWMVAPDNGKEYGGFTVQAQRSGDSTEIQIMATHAKK
ncbi:hypothetical protein GCM10025771_21710 [Niveibacterium umoris]|uniref:Lipoprotein n=1 Tax=Niveibacterium umoris TaxID=1193620 RepID=A0A840BM81_9RHOO|nr:hypothetical protein [Niveibacterium umoris]MBB4012639.1 hypothetical protein [Niveibacterium umoris]